MEFEFRGTFTHITYDCGETAKPEENSEPPAEEEEDQGFGEMDDEGDFMDDEEYEEDYEDEFEDEED